MAIDRIGTAANAQILLSQIQKAETALDQSNKQVSTGQLSDTYTGYGTKTAALEAGRSSAARADANVSVAQQASTRLDLQDTQLSQLSDILDQARSAITDASANGDGSALMGQMQDLFDQSVTILNSKDGSGYIYAGETDQTPPVTVTTLSDLAALPTTADAFDNGTVTRSARIGENRTVQTGLLASDIGTQLFSLFRDVAQFNGGTDGPFGTQVTPAQDGFLQSKIPDAISAATGMNNITAVNGSRYQMVQGAVQELQAASTVYNSFVANIQQVDMGEALTRLNQNQIALQAVFQVSANLNQLTLLNYLPPPSSV